MAHKNQDTIPIEELRQLLKRVAAGQATPEERIVVERWLTMLGARNAAALPQEQVDEDLRLVWQGIQAATRPAPRHIYRRLAVAAALLLSVSFGIYFFVWSGRSVTEQHAAAAVLKAGGNQATLTLSDGTTVNLNTAGGTITAEQGLSLVNGKEGMLVYGPGRATGSLFHTVSTPRGGQYQVQLPDGSRAWLNAASSLRYPVTFDGAERRVRLSGEAYFEVAKDTARPFIVETGRQELQVLGTHFDLNTYPDEPDIKTTLIEGKVRLRWDSGEWKTLLPGQQSQAGPEGIRTVQGNTEEAVAWKNGYFMFSSRSLESILRQVARWYDVEIAYEDPRVAGKKFSGTISKYAEAAEVLNMLELTGQVRFKIDQKRITVASDE